MADRVRLRGQERSNDLLMHNGEDVRRRRFDERKAILRKVLQRTLRGIQYVEHTEGAGKCFKRFASLGLKESSQRNWMRPIAQVPRKSG
jgi:hypothetical protein